MSGRTIRLRCPAGHGIGRLDGDLLTVTAAAPVQLTLGGDRPPGWLVPAIVGNTPPPWQTYPMMPETIPLASLPAGYQARCARCQANLRLDREPLERAWQSRSRDYRLPGTAAQYYLL